MAFAGKIHQKYLYNNMISPFKIPFRIPQHIYNKLTTVYDTCILQSLVICDYADHFTQMKANKVKPSAPLKTLCKFSTTDFTLHVHYTYA